ncbi:striated muscle preferentially expressed protein kinase isoform X4 [Ascaphus truei]|uniref:striated muscle preferentially expressed protein kinase isoform X4 n=1 Tax=Ascaphus truei TaxID=8439 RepID=UPI003F59E131
MKKSWMKRRSQKSGHSRRVFGRFTHVFRSCRKHSYDSEPGEEDVGGPQLQRTIRAPNNTPLGTPSGDSDTLLASSLHTTPSTLTGLSQADELSDWSGSQQTVVERDTSFLPEGGLRRGSINGAISDSPRPLASPRAPVLPPPSPRPNQRPATITVSGGRGPSTPLTPRKKILMPSQYKDTVSEEFEEKVKKPKSSAGSQASGQESRPQTPLSETSGRVSILRASPKLIRSGSKIFEKLRCLEERRKSLDQTDSPFPVQSWLPIRKAHSFDQPGGEGLTSGLGSSNEDLRDGVRSELGGITLKRSSLRHKTVSLDDRGNFSGRLGDIESRFSQELCRIKKTVSQQQLVRSSQDLSRRSPSPRKLVAAPPAPVDHMPTQVLTTPLPPTIKEKQPPTVVTARKPLIRSCAAVNQESEVKECISQPAPMPEKPSNGSAVHHVVKQSEICLTSLPPPTENILCFKGATPQIVPQKESVPDSVLSVPEPGSTHAPSALEIAQRGMGRGREALGGDGKYLPRASPGGATESSKAPPQKEALGGDVKYLPRAPPGGATESSKAPPRKETLGGDVEYLPRAPPGGPMESSMAPQGKEALGGDVKYLPRASPGGGTESSKAPPRKEALGGDVKYLPRASPGGGTESSKAPPRKEALGGDVKYLPRASPGGGTESSKAPPRKEALGGDVKYLPWASPEGATESSKAPPGKDALGGDVKYLPWASHREAPESSKAPPGKGGGQAKKPSDANPGGKTSKNSKSKGKSRRSRPMSPELESSDDSYVSAGEDPLEAPVFEIPLQSALVPAGAEVLLKCIISANPSPEVSWRKDRSLLVSSLTQQIRAEGERHTLLLRWARPSDSGIYTVTARNEVGEASSCGALTVKPAPATAAESPVHHGTPRELLSPITSDDEYLSPQEDISEPASPQHKMSANGPPQRSANFKAPPSFQVALSDLLVLEGQEVTLSVQVQGEPKPIINWLRNRQLVKPGGKYQLTEGEGGIFSLHIAEAERRDSGYYTCKAINEYGTKQCEAKLDVRVPPGSTSLEVVTPLRDVSVCAGEAAVFECVVSGPVDLDVDWMFRGKLLQPALLDCKMRFNGRQCLLLLNSVHEDDSGNYTCKLSTAREELTCSAMLTVHPSMAPLFTRKMLDRDVVEGRTARLDCKISGTPPPVITWTHFGRPVQESDALRIERDRGHHTLLITHVATEDEGQYTVTARNPHGEAECSAELYVEEPRPAAASHISKLVKMPSIPEEPEVQESEVEGLVMPDFLRPLPDLDVVESREVELECQVTGMPYPTITWYHNGQKIQSSEDRKMTQYKDIHRLVFPSVSHPHAGVYKSVISNKVGKAACYAHLYVADMVPTPPDGPPVITSVTGRIVKLRWKPPKRLDPAIDRAQITYSVQQQAVGSPQWTVIASDLKDTCHCVTSLTKRHQYLFRVITYTSTAHSKPSPPSEFVSLLDRGQYLEEAPLILDRPEVLYMVENQLLCVTVTLNHVDAEVTWRRAEAVLCSVDGVCEMSMPDDDQHSLTLCSPRKFDLGHLTCEARNQYGEDSCTICIEMAETPRFESIMEDIEIGVEETARFAVVVDGKPVPDIMWYKDGELLAESSHFSFVYDDTECSLVILNTSPSDAGVYTCTARNLSGELSCKAELQVCTAKPAGASVLEESDGLKSRRLTDYYNIHKEMGRGAFSYVRHVIEKSSGRDFAAKFISSRGAARERAQREQRVLSPLSHESIVYFQEAFEKRNALIIIIELCSQEELLDRVTRKPTVCESEIRSFVCQILEGLDYLHRKNILHLDIKPENILMADASSEQIRICDFGNAQELTVGEPQYCRYGTPEFVAPEIVNQMPISAVTDIWPVGVLTYLCLTGVSPFVGENDYTTLMNIRGYTVAFEEKMFEDLTREARGFLIKVLGNEKLRPNAEESLEHPWFKTLAKGKSISTDPMKLFQSRRKWQRSLINYKSNMVMRSIPELLQDTSNHLSIAIPKHPKESSGLSSSSDSDDLEELPFVPMPLQVQFSSSRMSLNEIPTDDELPSQSQEDAIVPGFQEEGEESMEPVCAITEPETQRREAAEVSSRRPRGSLTRKRSSEVESNSSSDEEISETQRKQEHPRKPLKKGSSLEAPEAPVDELATPRRGEFRRGSSADSALLLNLSPEDGEGRDRLDRGMTKAASMELPTRSRSPARLEDRSSQRRKLGSADEEYAQRLELMRQRLLRGGSADGKLSGLRGPLMETLSVDKKRAEQQSMRAQRSEQMTSSPKPIPAIKLTRAASSEAAPGREATGERVLRKTSSFSHSDTEPLVLHRRSGAPLEIPLAQVEAQRLKESPSLSALTDQSQLESRPVTPRESSPKPLTPDLSQPKFSTGEPGAQNVKETEKDTASSPPKSEKEKICKEKILDIGLLKVNTVMKDAVPKKEIPGIQLALAPEKPPRADKTLSKVAAVPVEETPPKQPSPLPFLTKEPLPKPTKEPSPPPKLTKEPPTTAVKHPLPKPKQTKEPTPEKHSLALPVQIKEPLPKPVIVTSPLPVQLKKPSPVPMIVPPPLQVPVIVRSTLPVHVREPPAVPVKIPSPQLMPVREPPSVPGSQQSQAITTARRSPYADMLQTLQISTSPEGSQEPEESLKGPKGTSAAKPSPQEMSLLSAEKRKPHSTTTAKVASHVIQKEEAAESPVMSTLEKTSSTENVPFISNIDSEEVFEAKFKRNRESSLTRGLKLLTKSRSEEKNLAAAHASREEDMYRPSPVGVPLEFLVPQALGIEDRSRSVQDLPEAERDSGFMRRLSLRFKRTPSTERKERSAEEGEGSSLRGRRLSWTLGRGSSKERKDTDSLQSETGSIEVITDTSVKEQKKPSDSPVLAIKKKIGSTMDRFSMRLRSQSEDRRETERVERKEERPEKRTPLMSLLRRSNSEGENMRKIGIPQNQLASQAGSAPSTESIQSGLSIKSEMVVKDTGDGRSRWDRWGLSRGKKEKVIPQSSIPASLMHEDGSIVGRQYIRNESDFQPVFHIKLKNMVILEGESASLSCLAAGSPAPQILWKKDKMVIDPEQVNIVSCPDGRQLLTITKAGQREAGLYECVAANALGSASSTCLFAVARIPGPPGTPEIPQKYKNTVLVLWKVLESCAPCTYTLEHKLNGEGKWQVIKTGITDCYFNVTELPAGSVRFRVACVTKAGQGPYSNVSKNIVIETADQKPVPPGTFTAQKLRPVGHSASSFAPVVTPHVTSAPTLSPPIFSTPKLPPSVGSPVEVTSPVTTALATITPTQPHAKGPPPPTPPRRHRGIIPTPPTTPSLGRPTFAMAVPPSQALPVNKLQSSTVSPAVAAGSRVSTVTVSPGLPLSHLRVPPPPPAQQAKPAPEPMAKTAPVSMVQQAKSPSASLEPPLKISPVPFVPQVLTSPIPPTAKSPVPEKPSGQPLKIATKPLPPPVAPKPAAKTPSVPIMLHIPPFKSLASPTALSPTSKTTAFFPSSPTSPFYKPTSPSSPTYMVTSFISMPPSSPPGDAALSQPSPPTAQTVPTRFIVKSVTPGKEARYTPGGGRTTPSGRESTTLRQGVPQKPYTFLDEKARGRFGVIRECKENVTGKHFMAKIIPYEPENKQSVLQEYEVLKCLHHQRILSLHEAYITPRYLVLISEQCAGRELLYCLVERFRYSEDDVVSYLLQILQGLEYLHEQRILHLDIKPENIMVSYMNTVKIIDFGSAQTFSPLVLHQLGRRVGTLEYMPPEMVKGDAIGPAADIWGVGVLAYIMLSGRSPFFELDPLETENRILSGRFDIFKLYSNASQSASLFIRKILSIYPWSRPSLQECFSNPWLQDAYLMKLRRQTLTFTTNRLKEFLVEQQRRRSDTVTKHKVLLRSYHGSQPPAPVTQ